MAQKLKNRAVKLYSYFKQIRVAVFQLLHDLPLPDFNDKYDETIL